MIINKIIGLIRCIRVLFKGRFDEWKVMFCIVIFNELWRKLVKKKFKFFYIWYMKYVFWFVFFFVLYIC